MDGYEDIQLFGDEAFKLLVAHGPWSVHLVGFQQHLLHSNRPHIGFLDQYAEIPIRTSNIGEATSLIMHAFRLNTDWKWAEGTDGNSNE